MDNRPANPPEAEILLVEDNPGDRRLIEEALRGGPITNSLHTVTDGEQALEYVHRDGEYADAPEPDLVLLDLNLPRVDGEEVLHEIKRRSDLDAPVIVLAGVDAEYVDSLDLDHEVDEDAIIEKPVLFGDFVDVIREFDGFGLSIVRLDGA